MTMILYIGLALAIIASITGCLFAVYLLLLRNDKEIKEIKEILFFESNNDNEERVC